MQALANRSTGDYNIYDVGSGLAEMFCQRYIELNKKLSLIRTGAYKCRKVVQRSMKLAFATCMNRCQILQPPKFPYKEFC